MKKIPFLFVIINIFRKAKMLIQNHNKSQPLFLYVAFQAPHGPINEPPAKYLNLYSSTDRARLAGWDANAINRAGTISVGTICFRFTFIKLFKKDRLWMMELE